MELKGGFLSSSYTSQHRLLLLIVSRRFQLGPRRLGNFAGQLPSGEIMARIPPFANQPSHASFYPTRSPLIIFHLYLSICDNVKYLVGPLRSSSQYFGFARLSGNLINHYFGSSPDATIKGEVLRYLSLCLPHLRAYFANFVTIANESSK